MGDVCDGDASLGELWVPGELCVEAVETVELLVTVIGITGEWVNVELTSRCSVEPSLFVRWIGGGDVAFSEGGSCTLVAPVDGWERI